MIEIAFTWCDALSPVAAESPRITIRKLASNIRIALSFGRRGWKRITRSGLASAPTTIASPSTRSALAKIDPRIAVRATTSSPAERAKITMKNSGRLPSVDCSTPVTAGPNRSPTCSVEKETIQARPASATVAITNVSSAGAPE